MNYIFNYVFPSTQYFSTIFKESILTKLTDQQIKIVTISLSAISILTAMFIAYRCCFSKNSNPHPNSPILSFKTSFKKPNYDSSSDFSSPLTLHKKLCTSFPLPATPSGTFPAVINSPPTSHNSSICSFNFFNDGNQSKDLIPPILSQIKNIPSDTCFFGLTLIDRYDHIALPKLIEETKKKYKNLVIIVLASSVWMDRAKEVTQIGFNHQEVIATGFEYKTDYSTSPPSLKISLLNQKELVNSLQNLIDSLRLS